MMSREEGKNRGKSRCEERGLKVPGVFEVWKVFQHFRRQVFGGKFGEIAADEVVK